MSKWKERNNKEEVLEFGTEEVNECRVLRKWIGENKNVKNRNKSAGNLWRKGKVSGFNLK